MARENRIITDEAELKAIGGGKQPSIDNNMGLIANDFFSFQDTTIVNDSAMSHSKTTSPGGNNKGLITHEGGMFQQNGVSPLGMEYPPSTTIVPSTTLDPETAWAILHPIAAIQFNQNANTAVSIAKQLPGRHNGIGDAYRHAYWSALNTLDQGYNTAIAFGQVHEQATPNNPYPEMQMDLNNNTWGATYALSHPNFTFNEFTQAFNNAVANGAVSVLEKSITEVHPDAPGNGSGGGYGGYID